MPDTMMGPTLRLGIDATGARTGAAEFDAAGRRIAGAGGRIDAWRAAAAGHRLVDQIKSQDDRAHKKGLCRPRPPGSWCSSSSPRPRKHGDA
jgi:hypothetical protein